MTLTIRIINVEWLCCECTGKLKKNSDFPTSINLGQDPHVDWHRFFYADPDPEWHQNDADPKHCKKDYNETR
jgi:hypothetical protein